MHPFIAQRRSLRAIDPTKTVPPEVIERLLEAARWAPSSGNTQPWRFIIVSGEEALTRARAALKPGNQSWAGRAPLLVVVVANPADDGHLAGQPLYLFDCGLATENLLLQGTAEGLVAHPMAGWNENAMCDALAIPEPNRVVVVIAIGWPGRIEDLPEDLQQRETGLRQRKPLAELIHIDRWNNRSRDNNQGSDIDRGDSQGSNIDRSHSQGNTPSTGGSA